MASSISNYLEDTLVNLVFNATAYAGQATVYIKLHTGAPGEDGTANAATETTRQAATFGASSGGTVTNDAASQWTNVAADETYTAVSLWDASTNGNCLWVGDLTASSAVTAGDSFTVAAGSLTVNIA